MKILAVEMSYKTAPVELRERLAFSNSDVPATLKRLKENELISEAVLLSTCNRAELYAASDKPEHAAKAVREFFQRERDISEEAAERYFREWIGVEAIRHLYRVSAGLESMVLGEPQILGQVKDSYRVAVEAGATGALLNKLFHRAFQAAKRVRAETRIGAYAVSVASTAVELAAKIFGELKNCSALLVGAGNMGELTAQHLVGAGVASITVVNRTFETAEKLAKKFDGKAVPFNDLSAAIARADVVVTTTGAPQPIITYKTVHDALRARKQKPIFFIDVAVPRDVEERVNKLENAYLYNIDDLQEVAERHRREREKEAAAAEIIVAEEVAKFQAWQSTLEAVPTVVSLRARFEEVAGAELKRTLDGMPDLGEREKKAMELLAHNIIGKILHEPTTTLKRYAENGDGEIAEACRTLFKLQVEPDADDEASDTDDEDADA